MKNYCSPRPLNILMVSVPRKAKGPLAVLAELLGSGLQEIGHSVRYVFCWGHRQENEMIWNKVLQRFRDIGTILKESLSEEFDLIYIHTSLDQRALLRDIPLLAVLCLRKIPIVILFHGCDFRPLSKKRQNMYSLEIHIALRLCSGVLVDSSEEQNILLAHWPWVPCCVVPQPVSAPLLMRGSMNSERDQENNLPTCIFAGRFILEKGVVDVLRAFFMVQKKIKCRLILAGNGQLMKHLQRIVRDHSESQDFIEFTGYIDRQAMWELYSRSDILLLPTYHAEGMPTVILEAMASGLAIICTKIRGAVDFLREGENARFVSPKCPEELADRIIELISQPQVLKQMKQTNLDDSRKFTPKSVAMQHIQAIKSLGMLMNRG